MTDAHLMEEASNADIINDPLAGLLGGDDAGAAFDSLIDTLGMGDEDDIIDLTVTIPPSTASVLAASFTPSIASSVASSAAPSVSSFMNLA